jgi:hypothetical protein
MFFLNCRDAPLPRSSKHKLHEKNSNPGKKQSFTSKVDGDKLHQSGQLSDGLKIEEVWQRLK